MNIGRLDRVLEIHSPSLAQDAVGQMVETFALLATVWAAKMDIRPRERLAAQQVLATETTTFRIRHRSDVTAQCRLVCEGQTYKVEGLAEVGRREGLDITATAIVT